MNSEAVCSAPETPLQPSSRLILPQQGLDQFLASATSYGQLGEWGIPWGSNGRAVIQSMVAHATKCQQWCLWVHDQTDLDIYPPSWQARGVDLRYLRVATCPAESKKPSKIKGISSGVSPVIADLKAVFLSPFFKVIVIDCHLTTQDYMFLARRARIQNQLILVLRKHLLTPRLGNIWAKSRINCWTEALNERCYLRSVKGQGSKQISFIWDGRP